MNPEKAEKIFSLMRQFGVEYFKHEDLEIRLAIDLKPTPPVETPIVKAEAKSKGRSVSKPPPSQAAPPVESNIPHHVNEAARLLKMSDEDLVDELFPDYSRPSKGNA